jgi:DNA (cytosine-5)-methyltransferase 1
VFSLKVLSLFSGIGAFELALKRIGIDVELVGFSEIDKYATKSYCAVHGVSEDLNLGDVSKIDLDELKKLGEIDLITHGSPCQDFSIAGRLAGGDKGSGTRSSLMWCTVDIVEAVRPKYVVWENVKNLLSSKNRHNFDGYLEIMDELGYNSYYKVLNAKNYGIPQNRERVFTVSIRKDIDEGYEFPEEIKLTKKLKDVLEKSVDEKYYLSDKLIAGLIANTERQREKGNGFTFETTDGDCVAKTVTTRVGACRSGDNYIQVVGKLDIKGHDCVKRVYSGEGIAPTLTDMQGGNRQPKVLIDEPVIAASRGRNPDNPGDRTPGISTEQRLEINKQGISNTITTVQKDNYVIEPCLKIKEATKAGYKEAYAGDGVNISGRMKYQRGNVQKEMTQTLMANGSERGVVTPDMRIRKLTPRECWRLMGFGDEDFDKARGIGTSDTQLYKQAGNSIVVNVLEAVFKNLFKVEKTKKSWYK